MKLASCDNCSHRKESSCALGMAPPEGEFLCHRYVMTAAFRDEVVAFALAEYKREINQATLEVSVLRAEKGQAFAG